MKMSKFDLAEELAIANIMNFYKDYVLTDSEKAKLFKVIKKHIFDSADRILADELNQTMEDTPMQSEADKMWNVDGDNQNFSNQEEANQLWGIRR